jgi:hemerythrin superfamily protein
MNAIDLLKKDHQDVQQLFSEFMSADADDFARREDLFQRIDRALIAHSDAEEQVFYPAMEKFDSGLIEQSLNEHEQVKQLLVEMIDLEVDDKQFDRRMQTLMEKVKMHVLDEEGAGGVLELARQKLNGSELDELGRRIQQIKKDSEEELAA